jgi:hypothetical protein
MVENQNAPLFPISSVEPNSPSRVRYSFDNLNMILKIILYPLYSFCFWWKHSIVGPEALIYLHPDQGFTISPVG